MAFTATMVAFTGLPRGYMLPNILFILFLAATLLEYFRGGFVLYVNRIIIAFALVTVGSTLPVIVGTATSEVMATEHIIRSCQILLMIILYTGYLDSLPRFRRVVVSAAVGFLTSFTIGHLIQHNTFADRAVALYQNPNSAAFWSMFTLFNLWLLQHLEPGRRFRASYIAFTLVAMASAFWLTVASVSRKVLVALFLPLSIIVGNKIMRGHFRLFYLIITLFLVTGSAAIFYKLSPILVRTRLESAISSITTEQGREHSLTSRMEYYKTGFALIKENPILGYGGGAFIILGLERSITIEHNIDAHSVFLDIYLESGLLGILAYLGLYISMISPIMKCKTRGINKMIIISFIVSMLFIQLGGSIQLDKYMWLSISLISAWLKLHQGVEAVPTPVGVRAGFRS